MRDRHLVPAEASWPATKLVRQARVDHNPKQAHLLRSDEYLQARPPAMVSRSPRVVPEHIGPPAKQSRRMGDITDQRRNRFEIESAGQFKAADEGRHRAESYGRRSRGR